ncbi:nuclear transport factor 2 family protein [Pseudoalteromonas sp. CNC9-20]|uniref:nuclear transport factor 2 family protein n=1 Tax=Pseudoalteromonas sp. CNC9-20 TaxID=2917750 RepID=UPI001EF4FFAC|nr:nuclear transport factor 2 family protein [Pseudoalteromonas sp. CNC9-20]MCG7569074.1 nuclear transport factor 2 family protein [Pseudoalteromonas sp. CNC9-20]
MKIIRKLVLALSLFSGSVSAQVDPAFEPVMALFSAMSEIDHSGMRAAVTDKFKLLENGEVWGIDELVAVVAPSEYKRENFFSLISSDVREDIALINYWNKAVFSSKKSTQNVAWLESVVVVKDNGSWRLQQMHSTHVNEEKIPDSVAFTEMR